MSSGINTVGRLPFEERSNTTIIQDQRPITAIAAGTNAGAAVGPAAGLAWRIDHVAASVAFVGAPAAGDRGSASCQLLVGGLAHDLVGVKCEFDDGINRITDGSGTGFFVRNPDQIQVRADASGSSVNVTGLAVFVGIEYDIAT